MNEPSPWLCELQSHRSHLLKYARLSLHNPAWAEDAVSETLLAAIERPHAFSGRTALRAWLLGILKHKLVDQLRRHCCEQSLDGCRDDDDAVDAIDSEVMAARGQSMRAPCEWGDPESLLRQRQFVAFVGNCLEQLPNRLGCAFLMRDWLDCEVDEICHALDISPGHLYVMLHRARLRLRECVQVGWFDEPAGRRVQVE